MGGFLGIHVRYRDRNPGDEWKTKRQEIGNYIAGCISCCYDEKCVESMYWNAKAYAAGSKIAENYIEYERLDFTETEKWSEISTGETYGVGSYIWSNIVNGLKKKYPEIDFECHCLDNDMCGGLDDCVTICVNGNEYNGGYGVADDYIWAAGRTDLIEELYKEWIDGGSRGNPPPRTAEEYYSQACFRRPVPTESNPYPIPALIPGGVFGASPMEWFCDLFQDEEGL
ncbi:MAG: hypothetical protein K6C08_09885 [Oscillospiraceae bacterium]|nr:hypothetical protein [Oscillospiraceae bacterium]